MPHVVQLPMYEMGFFLGFKALGTSGGTRVASLISSISARLVFFLGRFWHGDVSPYIVGKALLNTLTALFLKELT